MQQSLVEATDAEAEVARIAAVKADAVKTTFAAMANDPVLRRKREAKDLRRRFGLGYVDDEHYGRIIGLLKQVEKGQRLRTEDVAWLRAEAEYCWTDELQKAWHRLGSGLVDHSRKMTVAARAMAEKKVVGQRS